jgi:hypothetical protein
MLNELDCSRLASGEHDTLTSTAMAASITPFLAFPPADEPPALCGSLFSLKG